MLCEQGRSFSERPVCDCELYLGAVERRTRGGRVSDREAASLSSSRTYNQPGQCLLPDLTVVFTNCISSEGEVIGDVRTSICLSICFPSIV